MKLSLKSTLVISAALAGALSLSACATKEYVNTEVGKVDAKVAAHDGRLNDQAAAIARHDARLADHDARLAGLDKATREAFERADAAGKLAEGKFLYSVVLSDSSLRFATAKTTLSDADQATLAAFADKLKADNHNVYVEIQGHTDATGGKARNLALGAARAEAVRLFLNQHGVPLSRMSTISYGAEAPVDSNHTRKGRAANRRVVLVVLA
jgi:outer membrane protein OmpA-like peptidoglycan-associated protein